MRDEDRDTESVGPAASEEDGETSAEAREVEDDGRASEARPGLDPVDSTEQRRAEDGPEHTSPGPDEAGAGDLPEQAAHERYDDARAEPDGEVARLREALLRMQADMANREKRLERDMVKARKYALESLMRDFVQVLDSMDQALASADDQGSDSVYEGMVLTRKQALQVLGSHGLEALDPVGEKFDPTWHEAMSTQPTEDQEPDTVFQVLQKGYRLEERLIRPARVIVAKAP